MVKLKFWFAMASIACAIGLGGTAFAFHSGGVGECSGCHSMHDTPNPAVSGGAPDLDRRSDALKRLRPEFHLPQLPRVQRGDAVWNIIL